MDNKKYRLNFVCDSCTVLPSGLAHIVLRSETGSIPPMCPGQFVEVRTPKSTTLLNRPYSIYNRTDEHLELLVAPAGESSRALSAIQAGDEIFVIGPLGNGFRTDFAPGSSILLVGGGVGIAPLYYQLRWLKAAGMNVETVYGTRTAPDAAIVQRFEDLTPLHICTNDGTAGTHGFVTDSDAMRNGSYHYVQVCGPKPMMAACVDMLLQRNIAGEVSLENMMACGIGACLCCVENTVKGNVCVCKQGPVFNINQLTWK